MTWRWFSFVIWAVVLPQVITKSVLARSLKMSQNRGFSSKESDNNRELKFSRDAAKCLKEANGVLDIAQGKFFQDQIKLLKSSNPRIFSQVQSYNPYDMEHLSGRSESNIQGHEKLVEITWDTIAAFLPTSSTPSLDVDERFNLIANACVVVPKSSVLDVGCGDGAVYPYLLRAGADPKTYVGIDLSGRMIELAKTKYRRGYFHKENFMNYKPSKAFNTILFNGVLQFLPDIVEALRLASSYLKPGGRIVLAHANGAAFVRDEKLRNPATVLNTMPDIDYLQRFCTDIGATLVTAADVLSTKESSTTGEEEKNSMIISNAPSDDIIYLYAIQT